MSDFIERARRVWAGEEKVEPLRFRAADGTFVKFDELPADRQIEIANIWRSKIAEAREKRLRQKTGVQA